jgi:3D (Asp-Asp-Asp) domain-containing protein
MKSLHLSRPSSILRSFLLIVVLSQVAGCCLPPGLGRQKERVLMTVTAYCACRECCEWKRQCLIGPPVYATGPSRGMRKKVGITSDGTRARRGVIAADITLYPYATLMHVPGYGWGEVHDTGRLIKGDRIDVFFKSHRDAVAWGKQKLWVTVIRN